MQDIPLDKLIGKTNSIYKLVVLASRRAVELSEGAAALAEGGDKNEKFSSVALNEIMDGKITYKLRGDK